MGLEVNLRIPDLWQQQAVGALRDGRDVVVHAPTGAGKTYIFELLYPTLRGQAVFTVPTRALANDKFAEWRAAGWDVGICTGDVVERPGARVIVATLETQRGNLLRRQGPRLLVIDEYQMLGDPQRGANYELALALAPPHTQLLLLSGSVGNPGDVAAWLARLGRRVELVVHQERPVPLEEAVLDGLPFHVDPRAYQRLLGALHRQGAARRPRRRSSSSARAAPPARTWRANWPPRCPWTIPCRSRPSRRRSPAKSSPNAAQRVAYHHSGLSYAARAGLIEPLAKAGQLRAVVATTGLAAGVNFSLRSVLVTDTRYSVRHFERHLLPEELLQMFGRAGRRGLDDSGYVLVAPGPPRLADARPQEPAPRQPDRLADAHQRVMGAAARARRAPAAGRRGGVVRAAFQRAGHAARSRAQRGRRPAPLRPVGGRRAQPPRASAQRRDAQFARRMGAAEPGVVVPWAN